MDLKQKITVYILGFIVVFLAIVGVIHFTVPDMREITENILKGAAVLTVVCAFMGIDNFFGRTGASPDIDSWSDGGGCDCDGDCDCD